MSFTLSQQLFCLLWSFVCGILLGAVYDFFRFVRLYIFTGKSSVFICDFLFMVIAAFVSVAFSVAFSRGNTRYFIVFGEVCGFLLVRLTVGRISIRILGLVFCKIRKICKKSIENIRKFGKRVLQLTMSVLYNISRKSRDSKKADSA